MSNRDAPPDAALLADALEALAAGQLPHAFAAEELVHLLEQMPRVVAERRRRRCLRYLGALLDLAPEYESVRSAARRVAREFDVKAETVRWWASGASFHPPSR